MTPEQIAVYFPIGHSSSNDKHRRVRYQIDKKDGWKHFVATSVKPVLDLGVKTVQLHNPGGVSSSDGFMRFGQFSLAKAQGLDFINDFVDAFKPVTDSGVRVIGYIGSPDDVPDLWDTDGTIDRDWEPDDDDAPIKLNPMSMMDLRESTLKEFEHFRDAGVGLGLDRSSNKGPNSLSWWLCNREIHEGRRPVVELISQHDHPWFWNFDQLILYRSLRPRAIEQTKALYIERYPQLGTVDKWYPKKTFVLFRNNVRFTEGQLGGRTFKLWHDATQLVEWWNELRALNSENDIVPMMPALLIKKLIQQDLLKEMAD